MARVTGKIPNIREQQNSNIEDRKSKSRERCSDDHPAKRKRRDKRERYPDGMLYVGWASRNEVLEWIGIPKVRDWRGPRMSHEGYRVCEPRGVDRSKGPTGNRSAEPNLAASNRTSVAHGPKSGAGAAVLTENARRPR